MTSGVVIDAFLIIVAFLWAFRTSRVAKSAQMAVETAKAAVATLTSRDLDDTAKERAARVASGAMARFSLDIIVRSMLALLAPIAVMFAFDWTGWVAASAVISLLSRWEVLVASLVVSLVVLRLVR